MAHNTRLTPVGDEFMIDQPGPETPPEPPPAAKPPRGESMLVSLLMMTLRTLPAKTVVALAGLADLAMIASAFVLWLLVIAAPTTLQLVGVGGYAVFVLIALMVRRR